MSDLIAVANVKFSDLLENVENEVLFKISNEKIKEIILCALDIENMIEPRISSHMDFRLGTTLFAFLERDFDEFQPCGETPESWNELPAHDRIHLYHSYTLSLLNRMKAYLSFIFERNETSIQHYEVS